MPSSYDSFNDNPLCAVISEFHSRRTQALNSGKDKPTIDMFLKRFETEMMNVEAAYQRDKGARAEHMKLF